MDCGKQREGNANKVLLRTDLMRNIIAGQKFIRINPKSEVLVVNLANYVVQYSISPIRLPSLSG